MNTELEKRITMLLAKINRVTAYHRHGMVINKEDLDSLSNEQIEMEHFLRELKSE